MLQWAATWLKSWSSETKKSPVVVDLTSKVPLSWPCKLWDTRACLVTWQAMHPQISTNLRTNIMPRWIEQWRKFLM